MDRSPTVLPRGTSRSRVFRDEPVTVPATVVPATRSLDPYVPLLAAEWLREGPNRTHRAVDGTLAFVDISGFTTLTERLARVGRVGAEELSDILDATFGALLEDARADGADLLKWGGDAVLLLFRGDGHAARAARAAHRMRDTLRAVGRGSATAGRVRLRMSVGIHSGRFDVFLVGDPELHRELIVAGPAATQTARMEALAEAGQIVLSDAAAALLPARCLGRRLPGARLLHARPDPSGPAGHPPVPDVDVSDLLSRPVREHLLAAPGSSEHRPLAVAFVEFRDTDRLIEDEGPESAAAALDECVRTVQAACDAHDVSFLESDIGVDGGKFMLAAGAPRSRGQDDDRLLRAVQAAVARPGRLPLRAGVNRGRVFAGDFGPAFRRTYSIKGDAVNTAARVMAHAAPGQVLATAEVMARAVTAFATTPVPPFRVKGKAEPLHAVALGAPRQDGRTTAATDGAFVGRQRELSALRSALDRARAGHGTLVELVGEPGMGKSRLIDQLLAEATDVTVLHAPSSSYQSRTPYYPFQALLRAVLGRSDTGGPGDLAAGLAAHVRADAPELEPWLPLLGAVLGLDVPGNATTEELDPQFRREKLAGVVTDFLRAALRTPTVIVLDNTHLTDEASCELLARLHVAAGDRPWLLLTARRDGVSGFVAAAGPGRPVLRLDLAPIDATDAEALLDELSSATPLTPHAVRAIADKAGGNPLFLRALLASATRAGSVADLPDSVEDVLTEELDRLPPGDRTVLRCAAVLGMRFSPALLTAMLDTGADLDTALARLAGYVHPSEGGDWRFAHALIRDAAYAGLPFKGRRRLHECAGRLIETGADDPGTVAELLSLHFSEAGDHERAWRYSRSAGDRARSRYAYLPAIEFYDRAIRAGRPAGAPAAELAEVLEQVGDVRDLVGLTRDAVEAYRQARASRRGDPVGRAALMLKEARLHQRLGAVDVSFRLLTTGRASLRGVPGAVAQTVRSRLATHYAFGKYLRSDAEAALRWSAIGVGEARRSGDPDALAVAYSTRHLAHICARRPEDQPYGRLALAIYQETGNLRMQANCLNNLAISAFKDGAWTESARLLDDAVSIYQRIGDTANEANAQYNRADLLIKQRRFAEAQAPLAAAQRAALAADDPELVALVARETGRALTGLGRFDLAAASFDAARLMLANLGLAEELAYLDEAVADSLCAAGEWEAALQAAGTTIAEASRTGATHLLPALHRIRGTALRDAGRVPEARDAYEAGIAADDRGGDRRDYALTVLALAELPGGVPDGVAEARAILDRLGVQLTG